MNERLLTFEQALAEVLQHARAAVRPSREEFVPLLEASGRSLAIGVRAERDQPPFPRSTRDGFAVFSEDLPNGQPLRLIGSVRAGEAWTGPDISSNEAVEIMTGAPLPAGADAVLMVEHARCQGETLQPEAGRTLRPGENVVAQGAEALAFAEVIPPGRRIGAAEIALAAACGYARLAVQGRPRVAIVATGDELVELGAPAPGEPPADLQAFEIYNSNSYALAALVSEEGGEPVRLPIARDTAADLRASLAAARAHDLILFSGGVSMGRYDLVEPALAEAGAELLFTGTLIQPGKPLVFGRLAKTRDQRPETRDQEDQEGQRGQGDQEAESWTYFFGLPGNPVSTEVCFRLFVAPLLRALGGRSDLPPRFTEARLTEEVRGGARVTRFLPAFVTSDWQRVEVCPVPWQGSGDLAANARANGFVVLPTGVERFAAGETVRVLLR